MASLTCLHSCVTWKRGRLSLLCSLLEQRFPLLRTPASWWTRREFEGTHDRRRFCRATNFTSEFERQELLQGAFMTIIRVKSAAGDDEMRDVSLHTRTRNCILRHYVSYVKWYVCVYVNSCAVHVMNYWWDGVQLHASLKLQWMILWSQMSRNFTLLPSGKALQLVLLFLSPKSHANLAWSNKKATSYIKAPHRSVFVFHRRFCMSCNSKTQHDSYPQQQKHVTLHSASLSSSCNAKESGAREPVQSMEKAWKKHGNVCRKMATTCKDQISVRKQTAELTRSKSITYTRKKKVKKVRMKRRRTRKCKQRELLFPLFRSLHSFACWNGNHVSDLDRKHKTTGDRNSLSGFLCPKGRDLQAGTFFLLQLSRCSP